MSFPYEGRDRNEKCKKKATKKTESQSFVSNLASWTTVLRNIHYFFTQSQFVKHIIQFIKEQIGM
ncbi:hypothetical protein BHL35_29190 [Bacillus cereus]|nr:hypothetical protein BHL35_29190 [Bacillus cereus]